MKILFYQSIIIIFIVFLLTTILTIISKKSYYDREKNSSFECGFDPKNKARLPFSVQFFLIAIIFTIFDVELTLLLPLILIFKMTNIWLFSLLSIFFITILLAGLLHETNQGSLNWMK